MTDDKNKVADKASEFAKSIWLAGVGAYGRAVDEAQERLEKAGMDTPKLFKDLVKAGAALEEEARSAITASQEARQSVEDRINRVRENFRLQRRSRSDDLQALHDKIDRLSEELAHLRSLVGTGKPAPARRKAASKKVSAKTTSTRKTTAKKTLAKEPTLQKTATRKTTSRKKAPAKKTSVRAGSRG